MAKSSNSNSPIPAPPAHVEVYTAWQLAKKLFPRRKVLNAYYQSRNTDDGLVIEVPHDRIKGETAQEYYSDAALLSLMRTKFGAWKVSSSQTIVEDEHGHKTSEWTRAFFIA